MREIENSRRSRSRFGFSEERNGLIYIEREKKNKEEGGLAGSGEVGATDIGSLTTSKR